ncbi:glycosyltransferase family 4 protein [Vibrio cholerae]|nr:glycosyltransferase family 4 protein [Vibrio cholerae]EGR0600400.1 glycosyltransferase family 4 protein [Vibrio cholerae]
MSEILFYGETTKFSVHGVSLSNDLFLKDFSSHSNIDVINECSHLHDHGKVGLSKILNFVKALCLAVKMSCNNKYDYYYSVYSVSVMGALKSLLMLLCVKLVSPKTKLVIHIHRGDLSQKSESSLFFRVLTKLAIKLCYKIILISKKQVADYTAARMFGADSYIYVANTIELPPQFQAESECEGKYLYLSNYIKEKGIFDLLDAWNLLSDNFQLKCFGGETAGVSIASLKAHVENTYVDIQSTVSGVAKFNEISKAKALILPSWNEGAPLVILEAMSMGTPIIATDVGFIREMLGDDYLYLFEARNTKQLAEMVIDFEHLTGKERLQLGAYLKARFNTEFSRSRRVNDFLQVFQ